MTLVYGLPGLLVLSLVPIGLPTGRPETALALFPKLAANAICVESLRDAVARDAYALRYANLAIWADVLGSFSG